CGAIIKVMDGYRVDWVPGSIRLFEDITRRIGKIRAEAKALVPPDMVLDKLVKEIGNSIYGKVAQAVASTRIIKDDVEQRHVFNTKFGVTDQMGPSAITNAMMAAYCTGLVRGLLTETLTRLPAGMWVGTATTDGMLIAGGLKDIDQNGLDKVGLLAQASQAAFVGGNIPAGWNVVTPAQLGLGSQY